MAKSQTIYTVIDIIKSKYHDITLKKAIDIFTDTVENYKKSKKKQKLKWVAQAFIDSCLVMSVDYLTGIQCGEIANNLATDLGTNKDTVERKIDKLIKKERK